MLPENHPDFRAQDGTVDFEKYQTYLSSMGENDEEEGDIPEEATELDLEYANFLFRRQEEAIVAENYHCWPDNIPWNQQPWWKWEIWRAYWAGKGQAVRDKNRNA